ncbi:IS3 family transposase [Blastopirellula sp. JC732]|uniref:IS3 family transposase n=1 Tax=Blastopirellula sediminis TaxID=2894196 RepID=A0A9X1MJJ6_9BACT|nr:IS3 family transposase [Blastopirellula sediminis]MCC9608110.1 IS3 family transposase [Blastopirellula sediminis]MCC9627097.1 IS3 family transposase [Blastopirellula sediminis]
MAKRMRELAASRPRWGYRRIAWQLRREGFRVSDTRAYRLWRREGLKVPQKKRKRRNAGTSENGCDRRKAERPNDVWCWDFIFDITERGVTLKWLSIVDEFTRECLTLKVDWSVTSEKRHRHAGRTVRDARRASADPERQRTGVRGEGDSALIEAAGDRNDVR